MTELLSFRAAVLGAPNTPMKIEVVECEPPGPGEVLVRMGAAGLCHTDREVVEAQLVYPMPIILGHEAAGTIASVGQGVDPHRVGERVVLSWNPHAAIASIVTGASQFCAIRMSLWGQRPCRCMAIRG
jgi:S-(hydroxymethyl)glutathione dehydrogenase/alcohol dehydrogenase